MRKSRRSAPHAALLILFATVGLPAPPASAAPAASPVRAGSGAGIAIGAGRFPAALPDGRTIQVFTWRAARHGPDDPIVIVLAGGGRNGDDYRDAWSEAAERYRLLVLAPAFDEDQFPGPIAYNLAGMVEPGADPATLQRVQLTPPETWLFQSVEAIFDEAVARTGSRQTRYDLFGHSAGGQIVHRMMMFAPRIRVRTALAANSGWYTTLEPGTPFPYGLQGAPMPPDHLEAALDRELVVFLGEMDNAAETRGHLRESAAAIAQGAHRLARGRSFQAVAEAESARLGVPLRWRLRTVPGVGHAWREMSAAAADYLYGGTRGDPSD